MMSIRVNSMTSQREYHPWLKVLIYYLIYTYFPDCPVIFVDMIFLRFSYIWLRGNQMPTQLFLKNNLIWAMAKTHHRSYYVSKTCVPISKEGLFPFAEVPFHWDKSKWEPQTLEIYPHNISSRVQTCKNLFILIFLNIIWWKLLKNRSYIYIFLRALLNKKWPGIHICICCNKDSDHFDVWPWEL